MTFSDQKLTSVKTENPAANGARATTSSSSTNTDAEANGYSNIWSQILREVKHSTKNSPPPKSLIIMGDNESGRSTLVSRLKGVDNVSKGIGLEYQYIDVKDEDRDEILKLNVWIPDGDGACTNLLKFALNESTFEHTIVAFVVSMSTPWTIMESLNKWANILREHVKKLNLSEVKRDEFARAQYRAFQLYQDPDETVTAPQVKKGTPATTAATSGDANVDDSVLLPLDPFILSKNIGLPIAVIVSKSDYISILDKELDYRIEHFDFIQFHVRRFCLEYGASLFYTTVKDKRTYDNLYRYLAHKLYGFSFAIPASVVDREAIFIPSGWDNDSKINILMENSATLKSDSEYADIIAKPSIRKSIPGRELETVLAADDQEFLAKLQISLNKTSAPATKSEEIATPMNVTTTTPTVLKTPHKPPVHKGSNPNGTDSTNLKNFFQNLLNKNAPSSSAAATGMSPTTPASEPAKLERSPSGNLANSPQSQPNNPSPE